MLFFFKLILKIGAFYAIFTLFVYYFLSDQLLYPAPEPTYEDSAEILKLSSRDNNKISAVFLKPVDPSAYTILMSHGNGEDLGLLYAFLKKLHTLGFGVLAYDYQGYGTSQGRPSEQNLYADLQAAYDFLVQDQKISPDQILLYGRSLGAAPTIDLAVKHVVGGIILQAPFVTAFRCITQIPLFPVDKYRNIDKIGKVQAPIFMIHGHADRVVPFWQGRHLYQKIQSSKMAYFLPKAGHNDLILIAGDLFWQKIIEFSKSLKEMQAAPQRKY